MHLNLVSCQQGVKHTEKGQHMAWKSGELQALNKILLRWAGPAVYEALKGKSWPAKLNTAPPHPSVKGKITETVGTPPSTSKPWSSPNGVGVKFKGELTVSIQLTPSQALGLPDRRRRKGKQTLLQPYYALGCWWCPCLLCVCWGWWWIHTPYIFQCVCSIQVVLSPAIVIVCYFKSILFLCSST